MPCNHVKLPNGGYAIVCTRGRAKSCVHCGRPSSKLCDYPLTGEKTGKTCDRPLCHICAVHVEPDTDYCQTHAPKRCLCFKSPGPPWYAAQCKLPQGHDVPCDFGTQEEAQKGWESSVR